MADQNKDQTSPAKEKVTRPRRTPEQRIADLEAKIEAEKSRAQSKRMKELTVVREKYDRALAKVEENQLKANDLLEQIVELESAMAEQVRADEA